jgi:hypothetical protein
VVSKKDGPGRLLLTQKRLYFLSEARTAAQLLTELKNIVSIDKYQHQSGFSLAKPGIKVETSSTAASSSLQRDSSLTLKAKSSSLEKEDKMTIVLLFKNQQEQNLWYSIMQELWSGLTISNQQCDVSVLSLASRHITLMDTLAQINYFPEQDATADRSSKPRPKSTQRHNEVCLLLSSFYSVILSLSLLDKPANGLE